VVQLATHRIEYLGMAVAKNHRTPGADVIHIAPIIFVDDVGACGVLDEQGRAADTTEGAHRGIHPTGNVFLGTGEKGFRAGHGKFSQQGFKAVNSRARWRTSAAESTPNRPWTTATRSAPASCKCRALARVTPPMATIGKAKRWRASRSSSRVAVGAPGLVADWKNRQKAIYLAPAPTACSSLSRLAWQVAPTSACGPSCWRASRRLPSSRPRCTPTCN